MLGSSGQYARVPFRRTSALDPVQWVLEREVLKSIGRCAQLIEHVAIILGSEPKNLSRDARFL